MRNPGDFRLYESPEGHFYVLSLLEVIPPKPQPYEEEREKIAEKVVGEKMKRELEEYAGETQEIVSRENLLEISRVIVYRWRNPIFAVDPVPGISIQYTLLIKFELDSHHPRYPSAGADMKMVRAKEKVILFAMAFLLMRGAIPGLRALSREADLHEEGMSRVP